MTEDLQRLFNLLESGEVARFHIAPLVKPQPVGHHCFGVTIIMLLIVAESRRENGRLMMACLIHDAAELYTGDIPFTAKRDFPELKEADDKAAFFAETAHLWAVPVLSPEEKWIMKAADMLEGLWYASRHESDKQARVQKAWTQALDSHIENLDRFMLHPSEINMVQRIFKSILDQNES